VADRPATRTAKSPDGDILALCEEDVSWSPRFKDDAIADIESGLHTYHVPWPTGRTEIRVVSDSRRGKYLRTDRDSTTRNNLDDLPDCQLNSTPVAENHPRIVRPQRPYGMTI